MGHDKDEVGRLQEAFANKAQPGLEQFLEFVLTAVMVVNGTRLLSGVGTEERQSTTSNFTFSANLVHLPTSARK